LSSRTLGITSAVITLSANLMHYPLLAARINKSFDALPEQARAEITRITSKPMDDVAAKRAWAIFTENACRK
jgi:hypothetical protein